MRLKNKVALVTGAGGPMGLGVARRFAEEGASLIVTDISGSRLQYGVEEITPLLAKGAKLHALRSSVLVEQEVADLLASAQGEFEHIDILINIVGGLREASYKPLFEIDEKRWDETFEMNLKGIFYLVRKIGPQMLARRQGKIVNISSIEFAGSSGHSDYSAAKAAVTSLTRSLALELAPHINVNCIAPGAIKTMALAAVGEAAIEKIQRACLLQRLGEPLDIANAALFLSSEESSFITGVTIPVSGGIWPAL